MLTKHFLYTGGGGPEAQAVPKVYAIINGVSCALLPHDGSSTVTAKISRTGRYEIATVVVEVLPELFEVQTIENRELAEKALKRIEQSLATSNVWSTRDKNGQVTGHFAEIPAGVFERAVLKDLTNAEAQKRFEWTMRRCRQIEGPERDPISGAITRPHVAVIDPSVITSNTKPGKYGEGPYAPVASSVAGLDKA